MGWFISHLLQSWPFTTEKKNLSAVTPKPQSPSFFISFFRIYSLLHLMALGRGKIIIKGALDRVQLRQMIRLQKSIFMFTRAIKHQCFPPLIKSDWNQKVSSACSTRSHGWRYISIKLAFRLAVSSPLALSLWLRGRLGQQHHPFIQACINPV